MKINISGQSVAGGSGYSTVEEEGSPLTQRTTLNFVGGGVTATDSGGKTVVTITGSASGSSGTTTVDFGAFPGKSDTTATITGQASILAGSIVNAWIVPTATADHSADEHWCETIDVCAGNISAGTGFTIYAKNTSQLNETPVGQTSANWAKAGKVGKGTKLYGQFTVHWQWS